MRVWNLEGGSSTLALQRRVTGVSALSLSADGRRLAYVAHGRSGGTVRVLDLERGEWAAFRAEYRGDVMDVSFSPSGDRLAVGTFEGVVEVWKVGSGVLLASHVGAVGDALTVAWSPDSEMVAFAGIGGEVRLAGARSMGVQGTLAEHVGPVLDLAFAPSGRMLASAGGDGVVRLWEVPLGGLAAEVRAHEDGVQGVALDPSGGVMASCGADGVVTLWNTDRLGVEWSALGVEEGGGRAWGVEFSGNGRMLVSSGEDWTVRLFDAKSGAVVAWLGVEEGAGSAVVDGSGSVVAVATPVGVQLCRIVDDACVTLTTMMRGDEEHFFAFARNGLWDGDDKAAASQMMMYRLGPDVAHGEMLTADQLGDAFHHPGLVADLVAGKPLDLPESVREGVGPPPGVEFAGDVLPEVEGSEVPICVRVTDRGGGVAFVRASGNGEAAVDPLPSGSDLPGAPACTEPGEYLFAVPLVGGENELAVEAVNEVGGVRSRPLKVRVERVGPAPPVRLLVLAISVSEPFGFDRLPYADDDADGVVEALRRQGQAGGLYEEVVVERLQDADVTREHVFGAASRLVARVQPQASDVFVFYVAGHAVVGEAGTEMAGRYLVQTGDRSVGAQDPLTSDDFAWVFKTAGAGKQVLILDTCFSGAMPIGSLGALAQDEENANPLAMTPPEQLTLEQQMRWRIRQLGRAQGISVYSAASASEEALEVSGVHHGGLFTYVFLEGLGGKADAGTPDGFVDTAELGDYVTSTVEEVLKARNLARTQEPQVQVRGAPYYLVRVEP